MVVSDATKAQQGCFGELLPPHLPTALFRLNESSWYIS